MASEFDRIALIQDILGPPPPGVSLGIGDDAAIISPCAPDEALVWTVDSFVENVHFRSDLMTWQDVGWRSFMTAASDLAAMAASPVGALSAIVLPKGFLDDDLLAIARGQAEASRAIGTAVVGGNLSRGCEVSIATTLLGRVRHPARRDGARPGDALVIAGDVGLAAAGLKLLLAGDGADAPLLGDAVRAFRRPVARINDGLRCASVVSSLIDVSDGLAQDASHLATSSGVRIDLELDCLIDDRLAALAAHLRVDAAELVLHGGDDYALLATSSRDQLPAGFRVIGGCSEGSGVWCAGARIDARGHDHFRAG